MLRGGRLLLPAGKNETAAVVVTYNRSAILKENINCLLNQKGTQCDIYIIDNASTDSTYETVKSFSDSRVHYFNTGSNLGGAGGFEFGMKQAVEDGYKFVWVMDDDTLPAETSLDELFSAGEKLKGKWGALSSAVYWTDGSVCNMNRQKPTLFSRIKDEDLQRNEAFRVLQASFVSLLIKSEVIKEIGLPYGEYFIWTDDLEYTLRMSSRNHEIYVVPSSRTIHAMKNNARPNFALDDPERMSRYKYLFRNDVHCYSQYGLKGYLYLFVKFSFNALNVLIRSRGQKLEKLKILVSGYKEGISFSPERKHISN